MPTPRKDVVRAAQGAPTERRLDRQTTRAAQAVYNETGLASLEVDGAVMLADHIMMRVVDLNARRVALAREDPILDGMLAEVQATAMRQVMAIQNDLFR